VRVLPGEPDRRRTIVIIYNHGFSSDLAGRYQPRLPPILEAARTRNPDVVVFSQVRNTMRLQSSHHAGYVQSAVEYFEGLGVPHGNVILAGQSCGGWGSLQAAAFAYPDIGGVVAFAPTCHGRLPHSEATRERRRREIDELARRGARIPGVVFLYEGDAYYELADWAQFAPPGLKLERLDRMTVGRSCERCAGDSHGAVWDRRFGDAYFDTHLQPLIEQVRDRIRARDGG
jgi:dienelactone hydrolase